MWLDLRELELRVVRIHGHELLTRGSPQDLDNFYQLVYTTLSRKDWLPKYEFRRDACSGPDVDDRCVVGGSKDQLRCSIVPGAYVRNIRLSLHQTFCRPKVAEFERMSTAIDQLVLRLDVTVANSHRVNVGARPAHLVGVELHKNMRHGLFHLVVMFHDTVDRVRAILHHNI